MLRLKYKVQMEKPEKPLDSFGQAIIITAGATKQLL
jgi:hypothetical protein